MSCKTQVEFIIEALNSSGKAATVDGRTYTVVDTIVIEQPEKRTAKITFKRGTDVIMEMDALCDFSRGDTVTLECLKAIIELGLTPA